MPAESIMETHSIQRSFFHNEEPVLDCTLSLPSFPQRTPQGKRIDDYYRHLEQRLVNLWERKLYPAACLEADEARSACYPFTPHKARVTFQVTCCENGVLSLYWDSSLWDGTMHTDLQRHGDTWDLSTGAPLPMKSFLPAGAKPRRDLTREAMRQAQNQLAAGTSLYSQHFEAAIKRHWSASRFYIQEQQLVFFYPLYSIAPYVEGIPTFRIPLQTDENTEKKME